MIWIYSAQIESSAPLLGPNSETFFVVRALSSWISNGHAVFASQSGSGMIPRPRKLERPPIAQRSRKILRSSLVISWTKRGFSDAKLRNHKEFFHLFAASISIPPLRKENVIISPTKWFFPGYFINSRAYIRFNFHTHVNEGNEASRHPQALWQPTTPDGPESKRVICLLTVHSSSF